MIEKSEFYPIFFLWPEFLPDFQNDDTNLWKSKQFLKILNFTQILKYFEFLIYLGPLNPP